MLLMKNSMLILRLVGLLGICQRSEASVYIDAGADGREELKPFEQRREKLRRFIGLRHGHNHTDSLKVLPPRQQDPSTRSQVSPLRLRHLSHKAVSPSAPSLDAAWQHQLDMVVAQAEPLPSGPSPSSIASPLPAPAPAPAPAVGGGEPLPSQGFSGKLVAHANMKTMPSDWHIEYGPRAHRQTLEEICAEYPENTWCKYKGYHDKKVDGNKDNTSHHHYGLIAGLAMLGCVVLLVVFAALRAKPAP
mmetsp:Transcript_86727/g.136827  ORF Transcript_86727/g.136827 Transcript_86727/m.136827 type:complete len:247 (+) Transcript_86727:11-751(+)